MNMKVANDGCCARKEGVYCMDASVVDDVVAYGSHPYEEDIKRKNVDKRLVKESWKLLPVIPTNQVASKIQWTTMQV
jgi:hypothetical protein